MRGTKHTEEQIIGILKEAEKGFKNSGAVPAAWHQRADAVPLEGQVLRAG